MPGLSSLGKYGVTPWRACGILSRLSGQLGEEVMRNILSTTFACALAISATTPLIAGDMSTEFPVQPMFDKVAAGDINGATEYLTENAVYLIVTAPGPWLAPALVGPGKIGQWWNRLHEGNARFKVSELVTDGDRSTFVAHVYSDRLENWGVSPAEFDGLAVLRDGKVRLLALSYSADYEPRLQAARKKNR